MLQLGSKPQQWFTTVSEFPQFSVFRWLNNRILIYGKGIKEKKKRTLFFTPLKIVEITPQIFTLQQKLKLQMNLRKPWIMNLSIGKYQWVMWFS